MRRSIALAAILYAGTQVAQTAAAQTAVEPPRTWIDPDTGHRIVRLTDEPGSASLYFNQNGYTADGKEMVYTTPLGVSALNLETHATHQVVTGRVQVIVTGHKTQSVYYKKGDEIFATDVDTLQTRRVAQLPPETQRVLDAVGVQSIIAPGSGCCGAIRQHLDDHDGARNNIRRNIDAWLPLVAAGNSL